MNLIAKLPRRARWLVPAGAMAAVGLVIGGSVIVGAQTAPLLPARSTAQLLAAVDAPAALPPPMTATVQETANLGLPALPGSDSPLSAMSLLSGTHTFKLWYGGPTRVRVAMPVTLGETDLRRLGRDAWLWNSKTSQAIHYVLPAAAANPPRASTQTPSVPTPQQLARQILAAVGKTTTVGLQQNVTVAGQAAYQLSLAPKDSRSLIGQIRIAIDASNSMPLQVQVFARGASNPAFQLGFTSISFGTPAASNFAFTPPPGAKVKTVRIPAGGALLPGMLGPFGLPGAPGFGRLPRDITVLCQGTGNAKQAVVIPAKNAQKVVVIRGKPAGGSAKAIFRAKAGTVLPPRVALLCASKPLSPAALKALRANFIKHLPASLTKAQRAAAIKSFDTNVASAPARPTGITVGTSPKGGWTGFAPMSGAPPGPEVAFSSAAPRMLGQGWTAVAVLPAGAGGGLFGVLQNTATPVSGSWGSGHLLRTTLFSVLITSNGRVLIGAVQPSVLYADAAQLK